MLYLQRKAMNDVVTSLHKKRTDYIAGNQFLANRFSGFNL